MPDPAEVFIRGEMNAGESRMIHRVFTGLRGRDPFFWALILLILVMFACYGYFFSAEHMPFRSPGFDSFNHVGLLRLVKSKIGLSSPLDTNLFPALYEGNPRLGVNYVAMALVSALLGLSDHAAVFVFGLVGIALFLSGFYYLTLTLGGSRRAAFLAALFSLVLGGFDLLPHGNCFSFVEMLIDAHYASLYAMGLMMFALALNVRYMKSGRRGDYLVQLLLSLLVFNIHLLTGIEYFLLLVMLVIIYSVVERSFTRRHLHVLLTIPATLALASLWPLYHWWSIFGKNPLSLGGREGKITSIQPFLEQSVLFFIGLPFLFRCQKERFFLLGWASAFALVTLSYNMPLSVSYYWRFLYPMRIPLVIGLALGLGKDIWELRRWRYFALPTILVIALAFLGTSLWRTGLRLTETMRKNAYSSVAAFSEHAGDGKRLAALPGPGYDLMGMSSFQVISVMEGHAPNDTIFTRNELLYNAFGNPDPALWKDLLDRFHIDMVLVPRDAAFNNLNLLLNGRRIARNEYHELWEVDPRNLDTEILTSLQDPHLRQFEREGRYLRFTHWADLQIEGTDEIDLSMVDDENGEEHLRMECRQPGAKLLFLNRGYIAVDPRQIYSLRVRYRDSGGTPFLKAVVYWYDRPAPDRLLAVCSSGLELSGDQWKEIEIVIGPEGKNGVELPLPPQARLAKIGLLAFGETAGWAEIESVQFTPSPR